MMSVHTRNLSKDCSDIEVLRHACATTGHAECYFELIDHDNFLISPHIGGSTEEAIWAMGMAAIAGLDTARDALMYAH